MPFRIRVFATALTLVRLLPSPYRKLAFMMLAFTFAVILAFAAVILAVAFMLPALTFAVTLAFVVTFKLPVTLAFAPTTMLFVMLALFALTLAVVAILPVKLAVLPLICKFTLTVLAVNALPKVMFEIPVTLCGRLMKIGTVP